MSKPWEMKRRTFLRGMGLSLALPVLDAMMPSIAKAATPGAPRFAGIYIPTGIYGSGYDATKNALETRSGFIGEYGKHRYFQAEYPPLPGMPEISTIHPLFLNAYDQARTAWFPREVGALTAPLPPITAPLEAYKQKLTFVSGLSLTNKRSEHGAPQVFFNDDPNYVMSSHTPRTTIDQEIANYYNYVPGSTLVFNPRAGVDPNFNAISYNKKLGGTGLCPVSTDPKAKFNALFGNCTPTVQAQLTAAQLKNKSILDFVSDSIVAVQKKLGTADKARLEAYLTNVRELEKNLTTLPTTPVNSCPKLPTEEPPMSTGPLARVTIENMMIDVMALAMAADIMPIATLMLDHDGITDYDYGPRVAWGSEFVGFAGNKIGFPTPTTDWHLEVAHHGMSNTLIEQLIALNQYEIRYFKRLVAKLDSMPAEPNGNTPLDNSIVMIGAGMSDGYHHTNRNLGILLAGGKKWNMTRGHVKCTLDTPIGRLYYSMLQAMGISVANFNTHSTKIPGLFG